MDIVYYDDNLLQNSLKSIFLAGPTDRKNLHTKWRLDAIEIFKKLNFNGILIIPEFSDKKLNSFKDIIEWELQMCSKASHIMFWIPRTNNLPAFTTNVEFGMYFKNKNISIGAPKNAKKIRYLKYLWNKNRNEKWYDFFRWFNK